MSKFQVGQRVRHGTVGQVFTVEIATPRNGRIVVINDEGDYVSLLEQVLEPARDRVIWGDIAFEVGEAEELAAGR